MEFRSFDSGSVRPPTWAERDREAAFHRDGVEDVYLDPGSTPDEFWGPLLIATTWHLANETHAAGEIWDAWGREYCWAIGLPALRDSDSSMAYRRVVGDGLVWISRHSSPRNATLGERLSAIEHLLDVVAVEQPSGNGTEAFQDAVNQKAKALRIGLVLRDRRFVPLASDHLHQEVVQPTLILLSQSELVGVDELYRKAFERVFASDYSGAVTASSSAVEQMLRVGLDQSGGQLESLLSKARSKGWIIPAVEQMALKLAALRSESDAHTPGTDDHHVAMFAVHIAGSIILHLAERRAA